jgi:hypothetical protein
MEDETWVRHFRQWNGTAIQLQGRRNSIVPSAGKFVVIVFWSEKGVALTKFLVEDISEL